MLTQIRPALAPRVLRFAFVALLLVLVPLSAIGALGSGSAAHAEEGEAHSAISPVILIGVPGLAWTDVSEEATPALWQASTAGIGSLIVRSLRTVACPADGWLALNTSNRAAGVSTRCDVLVDPADGVLPVWGEIEAAVTEQNYSAQLGRFRANLTATGTSALAIGPGAGAALASATGHIDTYESRLTPGSGLATQVNDGLARHDLLVIDGGAIRSAPKNAFSTPGQFQADQLRIINNRVDAILRGADASGADPVIILAGLADDAEPALRVLAISGPGWATGELTSPSTRQTGYSLTTDLQATTLHALGVLDAATRNGPGAQGAVIASSGAGADTSTLIDDARERQVHATALRPVVPTFFFVMVVANLALYAAVAIGLKRPTMARINAWWHRRTGKVPAHTDGSWLPPRDNVLRTMRSLALGVGALPVASYMATIVPWWRFEASGLMLFLAIVIIDVLLVALALIGPWRRFTVGPATFVAAVTAGLLTVEVMTGSHLQLGSVMGNPPLVAGRFYGMNNTSFAQFGASMLLLTAACVQPLFRRGKRWAMFAIIVTFGAFTALIDGAPSLGADFGGPPAILPAFFIMALLAVGVRITLKRLGAVFLGTAVIVTLIAFVDWLGPADNRTHIGNFFQMVIDGDLLTVIGRKLDANLRVLAGNRPLTLLTLGAIALVVFVLARPIRTEIFEPTGGRFAWLSGNTPLSQMSHQTPLVGPALIGAGILAGLGMALNDSGIAIPANVAAVFLPLLLAAMASWMLSLDVEGEPQAPQESEPNSKSSTAG